MPRLHSQRMDRNIGLCRDSATIIYPERTEDVFNGFDESSIHTDISGGKFLCSPLLSRSLEVCGKGFSAGTRSGT